MPLDRFEQRDRDDGVFAVQRDVPDISGQAAFPGRAIVVVTRPESSCARVIRRMATGRGEWAYKLSSR
jgi:hypothetical protein